MCRGPSRRGRDHRLPRRGRAVSVNGAPTAVALELRDVEAGVRAVPGVVRRVVRACRRAACARCSGPTAPARRPWRGWRPGSIAPTAGTVWVAGADVTGQPAWKIARLGVAHAVEGRSVFASLSVEDNLRLSFRRSVGAAGVDDALQRAYARFPRLGERRRQEAGTLSGGEQRMLALARVLADPPSVLIADELSLGLAPVIVDEVYATLATIRDAGTSLLIVEQQVPRAIGAGRRRRRARARARSATPAPPTRSATSSRSCSPPPDPRMLVRRGRYGATSTRSSEVGGRVRRRRGLGRRRDCRARRGRRTSCPRPSTGRRPALPCRSGP